MIHRLLTLVPHNPVWESIIDAKIHGEGKEPNTTMGNPPSAGAVQQTVIAVEVGLPERVGVDTWAGAPKTVD